MNTVLSYRKRKQIRAILLALTGVSIVLRFVLGTPWTLWTLVAALAAYTVFHMFLWRCPVCGRSLGNMVPPRACYNCGEPLEDDGTKAASGR